MCTCYSYVYYGILVVSIRGAEKLRAQQYVVYTHSSWWARTDAVHKTPLAPNLVEVVEVVCMICCGMFDLAYYRLPNNYS